MGFHREMFWLSRPIGSRVRSRHTTDRQTDGRTDRQTDTAHYFPMPSPLRRVNQPVSFENSRQRASLTLERRRRGKHNEPLKGIQSQPKLKVLIRPATEEIRSPLDNSRSSSFKCPVGWKGWRRSVDFRKGWLRLKIVGWQCNKTWIPKWGKC